MPLYINVLSESTLGDLVLQLWPEDIGAEEDLTAALSELPDVKVSAQPVQLAGPEVVLIAVSALSGGTLAGVAAILRAWADRHRHHSVIIELRDGSSVSLSGQPMTPEQVRTLTEGLAKPSTPEAPGVSE